MNNKYAMLSMLKQFLFSIESDPRLRVTTMSLSLLVYSFGYVLSTNVLQG